MAEEAAQQQSQDKASQARQVWARFSGKDCVKQPRAPEAHCIPCKKTLSDGTKVNRFVGPCKRDATVLASQIFVPWNLCNADGSCPQGRLPRWRGRVCWAFNKGKFTRFNGPAGVCIKESYHTRHLPHVQYALSNMAHSWRNVADFIAAYQWSMEQRESWGDRPDSVMTCQLFCNGQKACGEVGRCTCGEECGPTTMVSRSVTTTAATTTAIATTLRSMTSTSAPSTSSSHDPAKCLEKGQHDDDCCALKRHSGCSDGYRKEIGDMCHSWRRWKYYHVMCYPPTSVASERSMTSAFLSRGT